MTRNISKQMTLRLDRDSYRDLRMKVLSRDNWKCQRCGRMNDLHVHHIRSRGQLGSDRVENLITLCALCHREHHLHSN